MRVCGQAESERGISKPLAIDLFCGLGGWTEGLLAEDYYVVGFDIERHHYGDAALIVASPPCQEYSYMAMPWSRAKQIEREYLDGTRDRAKLTALFDACFRIQREATEAAGHHIPMVVENVRGAQKWVGRSAWNHGSFHLWGNVPALMPIASANSGHRRISEAHRSKSPAKGYGTVTEDGIKQGGIGGPRLNGKGDAWFQDGAARHGSKSPARKAMSAMIAKIPLVLSQHIARVYRPEVAA